MRNFTVNLRRRTRTGAFLQAADIFEFDPDITIRRGFPEIFESFKDFPVDKIRSGTVD